MDLAQAWIQASNDPIVGNNEDGKTFWQSIQAAYSKRSPTNEALSIASLRGRWANINKKTTTFNGIYLQINRVPWSGYNEEKYIKDTLSLYHEEESEHFPLLSCWHYLTKWQISGTAKKKETKKAAVKKKSKESLPSLPSTKTSKDEEINIEGDVEEEAS